jgi:hypothetical protein
MNLIAQDTPITTGDFILPAVLLVGFVISVSIGVWMWRTRWREHQDQTKDERDQNSGESRQ